jgi:3-hydroxy-9,10-secoandrosta-1,3,5(10)-triene-9,17-dione monooxygenase reductase component
MSSIDGQIFKNLLACWSTGITVISVSRDDEWQAFTANSFASVSMNPPMICMNVANRLDAKEYIENVGHFAISILTSEQLELGKRFAGYYDDKQINRFHGLHCETTLDGDPILPNSMAWLACKVEHTLNLGENTMFVGRVIEGDSTEAHSPLIYHNRQWGKFQSIENK